MRLPTDGFGPPGGGPGGMPGHPQAGPMARASQPILNAPGIVLGLALVLLAAQALLELASPDLQSKIIVYGAFWPGRFGVDAPFDATPDFWLGVLGLFTYGFLHGSWTHVILNSVWLLAFGAPVARRMGTVRFFIIYVASSLGGALLFWSLHQGMMAPVIGASAAVSGLTGALVRFGFRRRANPADVSGPLSELTDRNVVIFVAVWFAMNLISGLLGIASGSDEPSIAWEAHVGGFLVGLFLMPLLDPPQPRDALYHRLR